MCTATVLLLAALVINWELQNEEIKILIICTKFLLYFSFLSYHWALFPEKCLIKIVALLSLVYYLQETQIWPHTFLSTGLQQQPAQCPGRILLWTTSLSCQTAKLFSTTSWPFYLESSSPPVTFTLWLGVPAASIISFSSHNVEVTHKNLLELGYRTAQTHHHLCIQPKEVFCCFIKVSVSPGPLNSLTALPHSLPKIPAQQNKAG